MWWDSLSLLLLSFLLPALSGCLMSLQCLCWDLMWDEFPLPTPELKTSVQLTLDTGLGRNPPMLLQVGLQQYWLRNSVHFIRLMFMCVCGDWDDAQQLESVLKQPSSTELLSSLLSKFIFSMPKKKKKSKFKYLVSPWKLGFNLFWFASTGV